MQEHIDSACDIGPVFDRDSTFCHISNIYIYLYTPSIYGSNLGRSMMEMRLLRKRRRRGWSSSILHGVVIVTTITTTITFWNVVHDVNRMSIPIITTTTGIIVAMTSMVNVNGYSSATKHQRPVTRSSIRPPSTGSDSWCTNRHTTTSSSSLRDHRLGDDTAPNNNNINNNNNKEDQTYSLMTWNLLAPGT